MAKQREKPKFYLSREGKSRKAPKRAEPLEASLFWSLYFLVEEKLVVSLCCWSIYGMYICASP
jgi:hypothetical protein